MEIGEAEKSGNLEAWCSSVDMSSYDYAPEVLDWIL